MLDKAVFFSKVVERGTISSAAKDIGVSISTGSRWLQELEYELKTTLLTRTTRSVKLTESGEAFYKELSVATKHIEQLFLKVKNTDNTMSGIIRIASTPLFAHRFLSQIVGEFLAIHPEITFQINETAFIDDIASDVDLSIKALATYRGLTEKDSSLVKRLLLRYPLVTVCAPSYIQRYGSPQTPNELRQHNCLYTSTLVGGNNWQFEKDGEMCPVPIAQTIEIENSEFIKVVAINGGGIAYLPEPLVMHELQNGTLTPILSKYTKSEFEMSLYYQPRRLIPKRITVFKDFLVKRTRELRYSTFDEAHDHIAGTALPCNAS